MKILTWVLQIAVAGLFLMAGFGKFTTPYEQLAEQMAWVQSFSPMAIKVISALEFLGALGLLLPYLIKALPRILVPLAAAGLTLQMIGALITHLMHDEFIPMGISNIVIAAACAFVAYRRYGELKGTEEQTSSDS